jgi:AraC-like DNA-binding protein
MLTARSSVADQVNALDVGADAYVTKPFEPDYLTALVRSTVENRSRLRQILSSSTETLDREVSDSLSPRDRQFMDKVYALLEKSLSTGEIEIESIASELGVSRSKFFYKIKALTGQTPGDFFTLYKLNRAAELLREDRYKISAIASMVGFSSSSHFASLFKKHFGMQPKEFMDSLQTKNS